MLFGSQSKQDLSGFANLTGLCVEGRLILVVGAFLLLIGLLTWLAARCTDSSAITRPPAGRLATERPILEAGLGLVKPCGRLAAREMSYRRARLDLAGGQGVDVCPSGTRI